MTDEHKKYSLVIIDKEKELTDEIGYSIIDRGVYQMYLLDTNTIIAQNDIIRDSILNLLYSIIHEGLYLVSTGLTGNDEELLKEFENIKKMKKIDRKKKLEKLEKNERESYKNWLVTGDWYVRDDEIFSLSEILSEDIEEFFKKGKLFRIDDCSELLRIESRLMYIHDLLTSEEGFESYESINENTFSHTTIGCFYYFFSGEESTDENTSPVAFRISLANSEDEWNNSEYINARVHDFESKLLPYGVITLEDFLKEIKKSRDKAIKTQAQNHL